MKRQYAIEVLREYNEWRLGADIELSYSNKEITEALKIAIESMELLG